MLASIWLLRRVDYLVTKSVVKLRNPDHYSNPYLTFNELRERGTVLRSLSNRGWIVSGYDEVAELLRDPRISNDLRKNTFIVRVLRFAAREIDVPLLDDPPMLNQDPPDHTRLRKLVAKGFLHKYIQSLAPQIEQIVEELLDDIDAETNSIDIIKVLAKPLPAIVIADMMGVPKKERHQFERWSEELLGVTEIMNPAMIRRAAAANQEMRAYISDLTEAKRQNPDQDLISQLIAAEEEGDRLTLDELYSTCVLLLAAGHETTTRLIGNGLFTLLKHPDQMGLLRDRPELLENAIEEMLRYEPPVQMTVRFVNEDMTFRGKALKKGQLLMLGIAGANRDPSANEHPDEFDIQRARVNHLAFGHGIHLCLGMSLARMEARIAFTKLFERYPAMSYAEQPLTWGTNDFFRGLNSLIVDV